MKQKRSALIALILIILLLLLTVAASRADDFRAYVHWVPYSTIKEISWSPPATGPVDGYEYYLQQLENGRAYARAVIAVNKINIRFKTHGHYVLWVRAYKTVGGAKEWGPWANSLDPAFGMVSGEMSPWVAYVLLP